MKTELTPRDNGKHYVVNSKMAKQKKIREKDFYSNRVESNLTPSDKEPRCVYWAGSHWEEFYSSYSTVESRKRFLSEKKMHF